MHGPNVTGLGRDATPASRARWIAAVERPRAARSAWTGLRVVHPGTACGRVVGGNLSLVHAMAAAGRLVVPDGAVLALEDVTEAPVPRRPDAHVARGSGATSRASRRVVFGGFERCAPGADGRTVDDVLAERTRDPRDSRAGRAPRSATARATNAFVLGGSVTARIELGRALVVYD